MNANGSAITPLTTGPGEHTDPAWSPDGSRLAFANATTGGIYVVNADGSGLRRLTTAGENPAWSPDGSAIAFATVDSSATLFPTKRIALISPDAAGLIWITSAEPPGHSDIMPAWAPDGRRIAFVRIGVDSVQSVIYFTWLDGLGGTAPITYLPPGTSCSASAPVWSPDGASLLFWNSCALALGGTTGGLAIGSGTGSGSMRGVISGVDETSHSEPDWSEDGNWIVFSSTGIPSDASAIYLMRADGSHLTRLAAGIKPAWRPHSAP
jgi:Tol biopolymer transport system component